jgi:uncharacterized membrane protein YheB (UPF0754 family)
MEILDQFLAFWKANEFVCTLSIMPLVYGFAGWLTNWQAVKMIFAPDQFWGIPPKAGWQGIIPRKAGKMAKKAAQTLQEKLLHMDEVIAKLDARVIARLLEPNIEKLVEDAVEDIFDEVNPLILRLMPDVFKSEFVYTMRNQAPKAVKSIIRVIQKEILQIFDLEELITESLTGKNIPRLVMMFKKIGVKEFRFIEISGFYVGFALGTLQVGITLIYPELWTIPIQGVIVGYVTNWLAINMIFRPVHPKRYLGYKFQGLFHKRRADVSSEYAKLMTEEILNARNIIRKIIHGKNRDDILLIIRMAISRVLDKVMESVAAKTVISQQIRGEVLDQIKEYIIRDITSKESLADIEDYVRDTLQIEEVIKEKFGLLTAEEYENVLRDIFREDEMLLIIIGGILGGAVGFFQLWLMI